MQYAAGAGAAWRRFFFLSLTWTNNGNGESEPVYSGRQNSPQHDYVYKFKSDANINFFHLFKKREINYLENQKIKATIILKINIYPKKKLRGFFDILH